MSRRVIDILLIGIPLLLLGGAGPVAPETDDDVATYLEQRGLERLLALHLEEQLDAASNEERQKIAIRLANLYAQLLQNVDDPSAMVDYEQRGRRLLELVPSSEADKLRLAILRGSYAIVERIAEDHRLRMSSEEELDRAQSILAESLPQFESLRERLLQDAETIDRRRRRASQQESMELMAEHRQALEIYRRAAFLNAWSLYYQAYLTGRPDRAHAAIEIFWQLLDPDATEVRADELSGDLLETEAYARMTLGVALSQSMTGNVNSATRYLDALAQEYVFASIRDQTPGWRMAVLLENREFDQAQRLIDTMQGNDDEESLPLAWIRLAAVHGLESADQDRNAAELASFAIAELASRGELNQVLDLAERYGTSALGDQGFGVLYVRGVQQYEDARTAHGSDEPTTQSDIRAMYAQAEELLSGAMDQPDAVSFPEASAGAQLMIGWCQYFQSHFLEARAAFEQASTNLPVSKAPEALWMAIVSLDEVVKRDEEPVRVAELERLISRFIERYPASEYTPKLILRHTDLAVAEPSMEIVEELLRIPSNSPDYAAAQQRASQMLYELYLDTEGEEQTDLGLQYLRTAYPAWQQTAVDQFIGDDVQLQVFVVRGRRLLDVALNRRIQRTQIATEVLNRFEVLADDSSFDLSNLEDEFDYRRMQIALDGGSYEQARVFADRILERDNDNDWPRATARTMFRAAVTQWRTASDDGSLKRAMIQQVIDYGGQVLHEYENDATALQDDTVAVFYSTVAEAAMQSWRRFGSVEDGSYAFELYTTLLESRPTNATFLNAVGVLAEEFGALEQSREAWARLAAARETGSDGWYEAKVNLIRVLNRIDPDRAKAVFDQFKALDPDLGPEPWRDRFLQLADQIDHARRMREIERSGTRDEGENAGQNGDMQEGSRR